MQPNQITYLAAQRKQVALDDERNRHRLVADRAGKHRHLAAVAALFRSLPPVRGLHARANRERAVCC